MKRSDLDLLYRLPGLPPSTVGPEDDPLPAAVKEMRRLKGLFDVEAVGHCADAILTDYLRNTGAGELADAYDSLETWRA